MGHIAFTCPLSRPGPASCPDVELKTWAARWRLERPRWSAKPPAVRGRCYAFKLGAVGAEWAVQASGTEEWERRGAGPGRPRLARPPVFLAFGK